MPPFEEFCAEIRGLWDSHWLTNNGEKALALEAALRDFLGAPHVVLFSNGHLALEAAVRALGLRGELEHHAVHICLHHARAGALRGYAGVCRCAPRYPDA
jgi:7-keto-8-aminopelargonate synthetase-like enzyme